MDADLVYNVKKPMPALEPFVDSFWELHNTSGENKELIILPDGRVDLIIKQSPGQALSIILLGLGTQPEENIITAYTRMLAISFTLPATEYILHEKVSGLVNNARLMPEGFWGFTANALDSFEAFCSHATHTIKALLPAVADNRKQQLFSMLYASKGDITVKELSEKAYWSSRQINRYFNQQYGLPLKVFCSILRFRASFEHIKEGKLFPQQNFTDQSHFIKEVKKLAGVSPKQLKINKNGRFIQFSALTAR